MRPTKRLSSRPSLRLEPLEDRALPSFGFGWAFNTGGATNGAANFGTGTGLATDAAGSVYLSGYYNGTSDFDPNQSNPASNHVLTAAGTNGDNFVAKYLADGTFQWAVDVGANAEGGLGARVAVQGSAVSVGYAGADNVGYLTRLDAATGSAAWTTAVGGTSTVSGTSAGVAVADGPAGTVYLSRLNPVAQPAVTKIDASGNVLWTASSGGSGTATGTNVAVDAAGNAYMDTSFQGTMSFGTTTLSSWTNNYRDVAVWKVNVGGQSVWAGKMGSDGDEVGGGIAVDGSGNVYVTGGWGNGSTTASQNNNFNPGYGPAARLTNHGGDDVFIVKLAQGNNGALKLSWAKDIGGTSPSELGKGVAVDSSGNVYTAGMFGGTVNFNPNGGSAHYLSTGSDSNDNVFVSELDKNGNYVAATSFGPGGGQGWTIALDGAGNVFTTGRLFGTADFDPTSGTYNLNGSSGMIFVSKLTQPVTPSAGGSPSGGSNAGSPIATAVDLSSADLSPAESGIDWLRAAPGKSKGGLYAAWLEGGQ
jgi:hypothetical protein